jgi:integrase
MHGDFTLFLRKYPNKREVYFYYTYDEGGKRRGPWTTKNVNKTAARNYCHSLMRSGALIQDRKKTLTFGEFAGGFWERGSEYFEYQESRSDLTDSYIATGKSITDSQLILVFGNEQLAKISSDAVNKWLVGFTKREAAPGGKKETRLYKNSTANSAFKMLKVMMGEAARRGLIKANPCAGVKLLKDNRKKIDILTAEEAQKLFPQNYPSVWGDKFVVFAANKLASLTGMRIGEILGLRGEYVFDNYILVCGSFGRFGYGNTKTKTSRKIPLVPEMMAVLQKLMDKNGNGYLFSADGGAKPVTRVSVARRFAEALKKIGISNGEIKRRGLTLHGWRHFVNTEMLERGLTVEQVQGVTGHMTANMTERYNHLDARKVKGVMEVQAAISGKPFGGLQVVKTEGRGDEPACKLA